MNTRIDILIEYTSIKLKNDSERVNTGIWQSIDVSKKPDMETMEILNHTFKIPQVSPKLDLLRKQIKPNLPWADDHFKERICGYPLNPGKEWANWPWGNSADSFRDREGKFNHNYMERYWPKYAGSTEDEDYYLENPFIPHNNMGIRNPYGDLNDIIDHLGENPASRQAYMPIFFPEDTGAHHGGRVPCTLGYHFIYRNDKFHCIYYLRSCDFYRHFRDDVYLTIRLQLWLLDRLKEEYPHNWCNAQLGTFTMHITSLHCFINDYIRLFGESPKVYKLQKKGS